LDPFFSMLIFGTIESKIIDQAKLSRIYKQD